LGGSLIIKGGGGSLSNKGCCLLFAAMHKLKMHNVTNLGRGPWQRGKKTVISPVGKLAEKKPRPENPKGPKVIKQGNSANPRKGQSSPYVLGGRIYRKRRDEKKGPGSWVNYQIAHTRIWKGAGR